jgi:hypothetical protein
MGWLKSSNTHILYNLVCVYYNDLHLKVVSWVQQVSRCAQTFPRVSKCLDLLGHLRQKAL